MRAGCGWRARTAGSTVHSRRVTELLNEGSPFLRRHSPDLGIPDKALVLDDPRWPVRRLLHGCYVDRRVELDLRTRAAAARLVLPTDAVLAGVSAAWLHGVPPLQPEHRDALPPLAVVRPRERDVPRRDGIRGWTAEVPARDVVEVHGVLALSPARVAVDLSRQLERPHGLAYVDALMRTAAVDREALDEVLDRQVGLRWIEQARELVELGDPQAESPGESWLRLRWYDAALPRPELQLQLGGRAGGLRLDTGLPRLRYAAEYDGEEHHGPDREAYDEARRTRALREFGWVVRGFRRDAVLGRGFDLERTVALDTGLVPELVPWRLRARTYRDGRRRRVWALGRAAA